MSINQLLQDTVKPLDIVVDTINGLSVPKLRGETYTSLSAVNIPYLTTDANIASFSPSQFLITGFGSQTTIFGNSTEYNVISFQGNLGVQTSATVAGNILSFSINASNFPNFPTNMVLIGFNGEISLKTAVPVVFGFIDSITPDLELSFILPEPILASKSYSIFFECKFRYSTPV